VLGECWEEFVTTVGGPVLDDPPAGVDGAGMLPPLYLSVDGDAAGIGSLIGLWGDARGKCGTEGGEGVRGPPVCCVGVDRLLRVGGKRCGNGAGGVSRSRGVDCGVAGLVGVGSNPCPLPLLSTDTLSPSVPKVLHSSVVST